MAMRDPNAGRPPHLRLVKDVRGAPPPQDMLAEQVVLGAILLDRAVLDRVAVILEAKHFFADAHARIYQAAIDVTMAGQPVGLVEIAIRLRAEERLQACGGAAYLAELANMVPAVIDIEHVARTVYGLYRLRNLAAESARINAESYTPQVDIQGFLDNSEAALTRAAEAPIETTQAPLGAAIKTVFERIQDAAARGVTLTGLTTGFRKLDRMLGGLQNQELIVVGARPGMGKTAAGCALAVNAVQNAPDAMVLFFSKEMTREQLAMRLVCTHAKVDSVKLRSEPNLLSAAEWSRLTEASRWLAQLPIVIDDQSTLTPVQLRAKARRAQAAAKAQGKRLVLVVLDYLQILNCKENMGNPRANEQEQVSYGAAAVKSAAKELGIPFVALAQLNRALEKQKEKRPVLSDLRSSGAIEQEADTVIFLHREEYYLKDDTPEEDQNIAELIVAKQRNGPLNTVKVRFEALYTRFDDLAPEPSWATPTAAAPPPEPEPDPRTGPDE
jgi:replicative DNA helicase